MSISPRLACLRRTASRDASRRASGCTVRRSWASCSACADRNSTCSICFGTAERATWSRPRSSAVRRRTSSVIILRNAAMRSRISRRSTSSAKLPSSTSGPRRSAMIRASSVSGESMRNDWYADQVGCPARPRMPLPTPPARPSASTMARASSSSDSVSPSRSSSARTSRRASTSTGPSSASSMRGTSTSPLPAPQRGGPVEVEEGVERLALARAAQQRGGQPLAQVLAVDEVQRAEHPCGVDGLARPHRHAVPPQGADERDEVPRQAVLDDGHAIEVSSAAARRRLSRRRTGV